VLRVIAYIKVDLFHEDDINIVNNYSPSSI